MNKFIFILLLFFGLINAKDNNQIVMAYVNQPDKSVDYKTFNPNKITHINYAFANLVNNKIEISSNDSFHLLKFVSFKKENPNLKVLISIGGWTGSTKCFYTMAENTENRAVFIKSVLVFIDKYKLDGIDLDWEFPCFDFSDLAMALSGKTNRQQDRAYFVTLLKELREALDKKSNKEKYLISITSTTLLEIVASFDWQNVCKFVDYVNLMGYDIYMSWLPLPIQIAGHHSNLYDTEDNPRTISVDIALKQHLKLGVPANKIVLGMPFYYNYWTDVNPKRNGLYQLSKNSIRLSEEEIEKGINDGSLRKYWDDQAKVPYYWDSKRLIFVSGEDEESIKIKCQYIKEHKLAGAMFWYYQKNKENLLDVIYEELK